MYQQEQIGKPLYLIKSIFSTFDFRKFVRVPNFCKKFVCNDLSIRKSEWLF